MARYVLSPRAQSDLDEIWNYTIRQWGVVQADRYILDLVSAIETAAANPRSGHACDEIRPGYFKLPSGSHVVFDKIAGEKIDVIRVLHRRMDFDRHL
jgi:toxin ParE1/3/4